MDWWGMTLIVLVGAAVVGYGLVTDRRRAKEQIAEMTAPPKRDIPRFEPKVEPPQYLSELQARTRPAHLAAEGLDDATRDELQAALPDAPQLAAGTPDRFVTDAASGWAVAINPLIAVCGDPVMTVRELLGLLELAQREDHPLVIVAPSFEPEVLDTLAANTVQGKVQCVPVAASADARATVLEWTSAEPLARDDLRSGYLPDTSLDTVDVWVSDRRRSWLIGR